jgi:hypothetical protein
VASKGPILGATSRRVAATPQGLDIHPRLHCEHVGLLGTRSATPIGTRGVNSSCSQGAQSYLLVLTGGRAVAIAADGL